MDKNESGLVEILVDGMPVRAREGEPLIQAARSAGFDIPGLCWHRKLSPTGACRLCLVKVEGSRGLVTSCSTPVRAGMRVTAFDAELEEARRFALSYLLAESACGSDGSFRDELEELGLRYGLLGPGAPALPGLDAPARDAEVDASSPALSYDPARCIKCFRCVKACAEVQGKGVLSMVDRGLGARVAAGEMATGGERAEAAAGGSGAAAGPRDEMSHNAQRGAGPAAAVGEFAPAASRGDGAPAGSWAASECDGCGECVQLCPTGALVERPNRAELAAARRAGATKKVLSTCPYCGVGCQLDLEVAGNRILRAEGREGLLPNDGRLCVKGRFGYGFVASPERLAVPLVREGGSLREASWDEALGRVAEGLLAARRAGGPAAVAGYASAKCTNEENYLFQKLFRAVLGTNNIDYCTRLCHASTVTAMLRSLGDGAGSNSIEDYAQTACVLVIGNNMAETHPVTATWLRAGRRAGGRLVVIDPKDTPLARVADVSLRPRLGTDVALLNGMLRVALAEGWVDRDFVARRVRGGREALAELEVAVGPYTPLRVEEICGVKPADLREATRLYATAPHAIIATGMGMSQQTVGTDNVHALINLMLATGQVGKELAGISPPRGQNNVQGATDVGCSPIYLPGYRPAADAATRARLESLWGLAPGSLPAERGLTTVEIAKAAHEGKVRAMLIMGENPVVTDPNQAHVVEALERLDFLAVSDIFMTPTARLADVVLPAACWAEKDGTFVNSDRRVLRVRKAVAAPGSARGDDEILLALAERMGAPLGAYPKGPESVWEEVAKAAPHIFGGIDYARLEAAGVQWPCPEAGHPGTRTLFLDRFNTEDGLAKLQPVEWKPQAELPDADYPLVLNTGRALYHYHSSTMSRRAAPLVAYLDEARLLVHPADAARLGISAGERVRLSSRRGSILARAFPSEEVSEGELFLPFHFEESPANRLTRDELDPSSKIAPFKNTPVRLEKA